MILGDGTSDQYSAPKGGADGTDNQYDDNNDTDTQTTVQKAQSHRRYSDAYDLCHQHHLSKWDTTEHITNII